MALDCNCMGNQVPVKRFYSVRRRFCFSSPILFWRVSSSTYEMPPSLVSKCNYWISIPEGGCTCTPWIHLWRCKWSFSGEVIIITHMHGYASEMVHSIKSSIKLVQQPISSTLSYKNSTLTVGWLYTPVLSGYLLLDIYMECLFAWYYKWFHACLPVGMQPSAYR